MAPITFPQVTEAKNSRAGAPGRVSVQTRQDARAPESAGVHRCLRQPVTALSPIAASALRELVNQLREYPSRTFVPEWIPYALAP